MPPTPRADAFLAEGSAAVTDRQRLEDALRDAEDTGRGVWPDIALESQALASHLGKALAAEPDPTASLAKLRLPDLFLACACAHGDAAALASFDRVLRRVVAQTITADRADEIGQMVRTRLLVPTRGPPKIASYTGAGKLDNWVRVVVARAEVDAMRVKRPDEDSEEITSWSEAAVDDAPDPELEHLKVRYRAEFTTAFTHALAQLSSHHRNALRQQILFRLKLSEIAALHGVTDRTVKRWLASARDALRSLTRDALADQLDLSAGEFTSIVRLIHSQMDAIALPALEKMQTDTKS